MTRVLINLETLRRHADREETEGGVRFHSALPTVHLTLVTQNGYNWERRHYTGLTVNNLRVVEEMAQLGSFAPQGWVNEYWVDRDSTVVAASGSEVIDLLYYREYVPTSVFCRQCLNSFLHTELREALMCPMCGENPCCELEFESTTEALARQLRVNNRASINSDLQAQVGAAFLAMYYRIFPENQEAPGDFNFSQFETFRALFFNDANHLLQVLDLMGVPLPGLVIARESQAAEGADHGTFVADA